MLRQFSRLLPALVTGCLALEPLAGAPQDSNRVPVTQDASDEISTRMAALTARAVAVFRSIENLERRLKERGLALRTDIRANKIRLEMTLDAIELAIKEQRRVDALRQLSAGETTVKRLEDFLKGR